MASSVMIISNSSAFMVDSIRENLEGNGFFPVRTSILGGKGFREKIDETMMFLIIASDDMMKKQDLLLLIRDACVKDDTKAVFVIGYREDIRLMETVFPKGILAESFVRPFDMKKMVAEMVEHEEEIKARIKKRRDPSEQYHILLCDDDVMYLKMMQEWLSERYRVNVVKSGAQLILFIAKNKPDLILLDYDMPAASGPQVLEMIF